MSLRESIEGATRRYAEDCVRWAGPRGFLKDDPSPDTGYDFPQVGEDIIAAFETALLSDEVVEAAGYRLSRGAMFPDEYRKDAEYKRRADALAKSVLQAALAAMTGTEGSE